MARKKIKLTYRDKPQPSHPELDWDAKAWTFTEVFNAFVLAQWDGAEGWSERILQEFKGNRPQELMNPAHTYAKQRLRNWLTSNKLLVGSEMALHPAVWLRLLHFVGECVNVRFIRLMDSYLKWCKDQPEVQLIIRRKNPNNYKSRSESMDVFLLRNIDTLDTNISYKFSWRTTLKSSTQKSKEDLQISLLVQARIAKKIPKIGKVICDHVHRMISRPNDDANHINGIYPMSPSCSLNNPKGEYRQYQFQGAALELAAILKQEKNSLVSSRSDEVVAKAVRLYVKCS